MKLTEEVNIEPEDTTSLSTIYAENPSYKATESPYAGSRNLNDKIHVRTCDITNMAADAIVCSTRTDLSLEPIGICKRVWDVGGPQLQNDCQNIGHCEPGNAFLTNGYKLPAKYVLHTAGPPPDTTLSYAERKQCLAQSYLSCLQIVKEMAQIRSVAFPCLGAGGAGIQLSAAIGTAVRAIREWLTTADNASKVDQIILCMYDEYQWSNYCPLLIKTFPFPKEMPRLQLGGGCSDHDEGGPNTNVLCYKYKKNSTVTAAIDKHFGQLVETFRQTLSCPKTQVTSRDNVVTLELKKIGHFLHLHHSVNRAMLEFTIVNVTPGAEAVDVITCSETQAVIEDFLAANFDNLTRFTVFVRCDHSHIGERPGLWKLNMLLSNNGSDNRELSCTHPRNRLTHKIDTNNMVQYWKFSKLTNHDGDSIAIPSQHRHPRTVDEYPQAEAHDPPKSVRHNLEIKNLDRRPNIAIGPPPPREIDQDSWGSSRETSSLSENATESEGGTSDTIAQMVPVQQEPTGNQSNKPTPILSSIGGVFKKGIQKLRTLTSASSSSSGNDTENSDSRTNILQQRSQPIQGATECQRVVQKCTGGTFEQSAKPPELTDNLGGSHCSGNTLLEIPKSDVKQTISCKCPHMENIDKTLLNGSESSQQSTESGAKQDGEHNVFGQFKGNEQKGALCSQVNDLSDKILLYISRHIGNKHKELGIELGLLECEVQGCQQKAEGNFNMYGLYILKKWRSKAGNTCKLEALFCAMDSCDIDTYHLRNNI